MTRPASQQPAPDDVPGELPINLTVDPSGEMKVENFCAGDNVQHFRVLPKFGHLGYGQPIFKQYNPVTGMYEYCADGRNDRLTGLGKRASLAIVPACRSMLEKKYWWCHAPC